MQTGSGSFRGRGGNKQQTWRGGSGQTRANSSQRGGSAGSGRGRGEWSISGGRGRGRASAGAPKSNASQRNYKGADDFSQDGEAEDEDIALYSTPNSAAADREKRFSTVNSAMAHYEQLKKQRAIERKRLIAEGKIDDPDVPKLLSEAITFVGTCPDMCPEFERVTRSVQNGLDSLELDEEGRVSKKKAVKIFHRPAAGIEAPLPSDVRPPLVLVGTLDYLVNSIVGGPYTFDRTHPFIRDRTRGIRQDFTYQNYRGDEAVLCHERIARFHIAALHQRCESPGFDHYQEMEQLLKVLTSLAEFYHDKHMQNRADGTNYQYPNEAEFRAYQILGRIRDPSMEREALGWPERVYNSREVQHALLLYSCVQRNNDRNGVEQESAQHFVGTFFRLIASNATTYLQACLAETQFNDIRRLALMAMRRCYRTDTKQITLKHITTLLRYESEDHARRDIEGYGMEIGQTEVVKEGQQAKTITYVNFQKKSGIWTEPNPPLSHCFHGALVESKLGERAISDVVLKSNSQKRKKSQVTKTPPAKFNPQAPVFTPPGSNLPNGVALSGQNPVVSPFASNRSLEPSVTSTTETDPTRSSNKTQFTENPFQKQPGTAAALAPAFSSTQSMSSPFTGNNSSNSPFAPISPFASEKAPSLQPGGISNSFTRSPEPPVNSYNPSPTTAQEPGVQQGVSKQADSAGGRAKPANATSFASSFFPQQPLASEPHTPPGQPARSIFDSIAPNPPVLSFTNTTMVPNVQPSSQTGKLFSNPQQFKSEEMPNSQIDTKNLFGEPPNGSPYMTSTADYKDSAHSECQVAARLNAEEDERKTRLKVEEMKIKAKAEEERKTRLKAEEEAKIQKNFEEALKRFQFRIWARRARTVLSKLWALKSKRDRVVQAMEHISMEHYRKKLAERVFYPWKREAKRRRHRREGEERRRNPRKFVAVEQFTPVAGFTTNSEMPNKELKDLNWSPILLDDIFAPQVRRALERTPGTKPTQWSLLLYNFNETDKDSTWFMAKFLGYPTPRVQFESSPFKTLFYSPYLSQCPPITVDEGKTIGGLIFGCSANFDVSSEERFARDKQELHHVVQSALNCTAFDKLAVSVICYRSPLDSSPADAYGRDKRRTTGKGRSARITAIENALSFTHLAKAVIAEVVLVETAKDLENLPMEIEKLAHQVSQTLGPFSPRSSPKRKFESVSLSSATPVPKKPRAAIKHKPAESPALREWKIADRKRQSELRLATRPRRSDNHQWLKAHNVIESPYNAQKHHAGPGELIGQAVLVTEAVGSKDLHPPNSEATKATRALRKSRDDLFDLFESAKAMFDAAELDEEGKRLVEHASSMDGGIYV